MLTNNVENALHSGTTSHSSEVSTKVDFLEEMANFIFTSKYARYNKEAQRRETWEEAVNRVRDMHLEKYYWLSQEHRDKIIWAFDLVKQKKVVPSMRSMQFGGKAVFAHNERIYNCAAGHIVSLRSFAEFFFLLLCMHPDTLVKTKTGSKKISEITVEDEVLSYNEEKNIFEYIHPSDVTRTPTLSDKKIELTLENGEVLKCLETHQFLTKNRGWVQAKDLNEEDDLVEG